MMEQINDQTFTKLAMRCYDNPQCTSIAEFDEDLKRFSYLKKLFGRYADKGELKERLILNHLIILFNVFGLAALEFLFFKIDKEYWTPLITFLTYMDRMCDVPEFNIRSKDHPLDPNIFKVLEAL